MRHHLPVSVWARGTCFALALLAAGTSLVPGQAAAQGTIVHVVPLQPIPYSDYPFSQDLDLNGDGVADFVLSGGRDVNLSPLNNNAVISVPAQSPDLGALIYAFNWGAPISSSLNPVFAWWGANENGPPGIVSSSNIGDIGYFQGNTDAFAGIRLDVAGTPYYGWVHIHNLIANWGQIDDWAYETRPDTQILAGAVPEPSCISLCALGILLMFTRRSQRRVRL